MYVTIVKECKYIIEQSDMCRSDQKSDGTKKMVAENGNRKTIRKKQVGNEWKGTRAWQVVEEVN